MKPINLVRWITLAALFAIALSIGPLAPLAALPAAAEPGGSPESIAGSYVYHNLAISPSDCFVQGHVQTFCFQAISYTDDYDYVYYLWLRFPSDWVVGNVTVYDTPYCINGGAFGPFSWYGPPGQQNELQITHVRYHANPSDTCTAYYCVQATAGGPSFGLSYAKVSWYWESSVYGSPPYYPCSADGYTPDGRPACDEMTTVVAYIDRCPIRVTLPLIFKTW